MSSFNFKSYPFISIIFPNWNGKKNTIGCLESLEKLNYPKEKLEIIIADNGSTDGSQEAITTKFQQMKFQGWSNLILIKIKENLGHSAGTNRAYEKISPESKYVFKLDNDTKVEPQCLKELIKVMESDRNIGSSQPKLLLFYDSKIIDGLGIVLDQNGNAIQVGYKTKDEGQYNKLMEIFGACSGAAMYRKKMLDEIGFFDEDFFAYFDDVDLALRAKLRGWKCIYVPGAIVYHVHSASNSIFKNYFLTRNKYYYIIKNLPLNTLFKFLITRPIVIPSRIFSYIKDKKFFLIKGYLKGNIDALKFLSKFFKKRKQVQSAKTISNNEIKNWFNFNKN